MTFVLLGWLVWSLSHYITHRTMHYGISKGWRKGPIDGEYMHHDRHDANQSFDTVFASFPLEGALVIGVLPLYWMPAGWCWGVCVSAVIDDLTHRMYHYRRLPIPLRWFRGLHGIHHRDHDRNYAFVTGIVWDMLLGTFRVK
jgi:sterol desaturase/sphingolipid hydroxylase (fatty acid hydroxylase superfamily)